MNNFKVYYSQNREDVIIEAFFPDVKNGCYVDVGANHPFYHSVTKIFYDKGWSGINLEPNPMLLSQLKEHRPKDINLMVGIGDSPGKFIMRVYHSRDGLEGISTLSKSMQESYKNNSNPDTKKFTDIEVSIVTLDQLLNEQSPRHIHFLKVDVEGFEYEVLKGNDWGKFRPELICIESNHIIKKWSKMLKSVNYELVFNDGINDYYLAKESLYRKKYFDYAEIFLSNKRVIQYDIYTQLKKIPKLEHEIKNLKEVNNEVLHKNENIEHELQRYKHLVGEKITIRGHTVKFIKNKIRKYVPRDTKIKKVNK